MTFRVVKAVRWKRHALMIILAGSLVGCGDESASSAQVAPVVPVVVETVQAKDVPLTTEMVGETAGYREIEVRSRVGGILLKRHYVEGQPVVAGDVLFEIDPG
ncbi:biotin/lipoyl-binding protein [Plesiomonas shigelloides]|uniref:biotin/lipoyl-binding protein n=1 Tax=Plesiomonas shigelloides TaxID=703 RepID=UPI00351D3260